MSYLSKKINKKLVEDANRPRNYKKPPIFNPSTLSSKCVRKVYYTYLDVEKDFGYDAKALRIFQTGDAYHDLMKGWLKKIGVLVEYKDENGRIPINKYSGKPDGEFPIEDSELGIRGKVDAIIIMDGCLYIGELKSSNDRKYRKLLKQDPQHAEQAMIYAYVFEQALKAGKYSHIPELKGFDEVTGVIYLYANKDTSEIKEFATTKVAKVFSKVLAKILDVKNYVAKKELPPKTEDYCNYCPFRKKCPKDYNPL